MTERDKTHLQRIKKELAFIKKSAKIVTADLFLDDDILQHAVCMSFISIGECANHLSDEFKANYPQIEWVQIIGLRNIAAHGYWQLDMEQIWQAIVDDVPGLYNEFMEDTWES